MDNNLAPLAGTSGRCARPRDPRSSAGAQLPELRAAIAPRPVFVITASEGLAPSDHALAEAIEKAGDTRVTERHWDTDHSYSGERAELAQAILQWIDNLPR